MVVNAYRGGGVRRSGVLVWDSDTLLFWGLYCALLFLETTTTMHLQMRVPRPDPKGEFGVLFGLWQLGGGFTTPPRLSQYP